MAERKRRDKGDGCISQLKDGRWTSRMRVGLTPEGKPKIKAFYGKTEAEVKKKLKEFQKELHKNDGAVVQRNTVANYMLDWLQNVKANELKPKSYDRLEQSVKNQIIPSIGHLQVAALTSDDVQKMINSLKADGLSYSTIKKAYDAVNECFKTGIIKKTVVHNPALGVTIPAKKSFPKSEIQCYTKEEADKLCEAAVACYSGTKQDGQRIYRLGSAIVLGFNTGLRAAEMLGLKWSDISFENRTISVNSTRVIVKDRTGSSETHYTVIDQQSTKTTAGERTIPMNQKAFAALQDLHSITGECTYVLSSKNGTPLTPRYLDRMFRKIAVYAGMEESKVFGLHAMRHSFACRLFENGVDVKTVSTILGHADVGVTYNTYIHLLKNQQQTAVDILDRI